MPNKKEFKVKKISLDEKRVISKPRNIYKYKLPRAKRALDRKK